MRSPDHWPFSNPPTRRQFLKSSLCGGGILLLPTVPGPLQAAPVDITRVSRMEFDITYSTTVSESPKGSKRLRLWMPIPPTGPDQAIEDFSVSSPVDYQIRSDRTYGNKIAFIEADARAAPFTIESRYRVVRRRSSVAPATVENDALEKYLALSPRVKVTEDIRSFTREVVGGERAAAAIGKRVFDALIDLLRYDKAILGCGTGDTEWIFKHRRGKCDDYHSLFMAMMISMRVPVRWEQGFPLPDPFVDGIDHGSLQGDCSGAHCWVSFLDRELGWVPVDVSEADKRPGLRDFFFGNLSANRFKISEGRAIVLNPEQAGEPLNSLAYAYAEADGIPLIYEANYGNTIDYRVTHVETL